MADTLPDSKAAWQYVNVQQLQSFLSQKIEEGYTFPLNPKWILCDHGWKDLYNRLCSSQQTDVQDSIDVWFPPDSGIRERIESISEQHPDGFVSASKESASKGQRSPRNEIDEEIGTEAMDLATLQLERYLTLRRAKAKLRAAIRFGHLLNTLRQQNRESHETAECKDESEDENDSLSDENDNSEEVFI